MRDFSSKPPTASSAHRDSLTTATPAARDITRSPVTTDSTLARYGFEGHNRRGCAQVCVPRMSSTALTSRVALPAVGP